MCRTKLKRSIGKYNNLVDTSIKHSGQSATAVHCRVCMFDMVDSALSYGRVLIVCSLFQESQNGKESSLHEI